MVKLKSAANTETKSSLLFKKDLSRIASIEACSRIRIVCEYEAERHSYERHLYAEFAGLFATNDRLGERYDAVLNRVPHTGERILLRNAMMDAWNAYQLAWQPLYDSGVARDDVVTVPDPLPPDTVERDRPLLTAAIDAFRDVLAWIEYMEARYGLAMDPPLPGPRVPRPEGGGTSRLVPACC